jgi:hypothetical protein
MTEKMFLDYLKKAMAEWKAVLSIIYPEPPDWAVIGKEKILDKIKEGDVPRLQSAFDDFQRQALHEVLGQFKQARSGVIGQKLAEIKLAPGWELSWKLALSCEQLWSEFILTKNLNKTIWTFEELAEIALFYTTTIDRLTETRVSCLKRKQDEWFFAHLEEVRRELEATHRSQWKNLEDSVNNLF